MNFFELAANRYSVRKFINKHLDQEMINQILAAGHLAPTGCNYQPQRYFTMGIDRIKKIYG